MNAAQLNEAWRTFWDERSPRERRLLGWGGVVLLLVIAYSVLWSPAQEGSARIESELPGLRDSLAHMTAQADEAHTLSASVQGTPPTGAALRDALTASLQTHGLNTAASTPPQAVGSGVQLQLKNVPFPEWTKWLDEVRTQFKVQVTEAHVTALKDDGQVDLTAILQPADNK